MLAILQDVCYIMLTAKLVLGMEVLTDPSILDIERRR